MSPSQFIHPWKCFPSRERARSVSPHSASVEEDAWLAIIQSVRQLISAATSWFKRSFEIGCCRYPSRVDRTPKQAWTNRVSNRNRIGTIDQYSNFHTPNDGVAILRNVPNSSTPDSNPDYQPSFALVFSQLALARKRSSCFGRMRSPTNL